MNKTGIPGSIILGVLAILWGLMSGFQGWAKSEGSPILLSYELYLLCFLPLIAGVGVLIKKNWGRIFYILYSAVGFSYVLFNTIKDIRQVNKSDASSYCIMLLVFAVVYSIPVWYFLQTSVKEHFK